MLADCVESLHKRIKIILENLEVRVLRSLRCDNDTYCTSPSAAKRPRPSLPPSPPSAASPTPLHGLALGGAGLLRQVKLLLSLASPGRSAW